METVIGHKIPPSWTIDIPTPTQLTLRPIPISLIDFCWFLSDSWKWSAEGETVKRNVVRSYDCVTNALWYNFHSTILEWSHGCGEVGQDREETDLGCVSVL